ncbi:MAG: DUF4332 domain-containing protein [Pseudomonadota bacterium]
MDTTDSAGLDPVLIALAMALVIALVITVRLFRGRPTPTGDTPSAAIPSRELDAAVLALPNMTPSHAEALAKAGVSSVDELGALAGDQLARVARDSRLEDFVLRRWVGLAGLMAIDGIDAAQAQALVRIGVSSTAALRAENPDRIQSKLNALNEAEGLVETMPSRADIVRWVEAAGGD